MKKYLFFVFVLLTIQKLNAQSLPPGFIPINVDEFHRSFDKCMTYPKELKPYLSSVRVNIKFVVDTLGNITPNYIEPIYDSVIFNQIDQCLNNLQKIEPATLEGAKVNSEYKLPVWIKPAAVNTNKIRHFENDFVSFDYFSKSEINQGKNVVQIDGKTKAGDIYFLREENDFSLSEKAYKIVNSFNNSKIIVDTERVTQFNQLRAEVKFVKFNLNPLVDYLTGSMIIKVYKFEVNNQFYALTTIDFEEEFYSNYGRNAITMNSFIFK